MTSTLACTFESTSRVSAGSGALHYHDHGDGDPLVMLHGSGPGVSGWANFRNTIPAFADYRVLVPDMPGFGQSPAPEPFDAPYTKLAAEAVVQLLDELGVERIDLVGNSMGGGVASRMALDHPGRIRRLVLMGPGGLAINLLTPRPSEGMRRLFAFNAQPDREHLVDWLRSMVSDVSLLTDDLIDERMANATAPGAIEWSRRLFAAQTDPALQDAVPLWARAGEITHPTLLLWGRDDRVIPVESGLFAARHLPRAELHIFDRCGHWVMIERREAFNGVVREFLERPAS
ncbi:MAG TPA: alpha/beta fold hydrolase [Acidimicrobiales bacterium]|nr:alpha/beta fold hydrolase [Acidimicrobiales bacterium]